MIPHRDAATIDADRRSDADETAPIREPARRMVCVGDGCGARMLATIRAASMLGWRLWMGGALCVTCAAKEAT